MPELPEVETVCRGLRQSIIGQTIAQIEYLRPDLRIPFPDHFQEQLEGKTIRAIRRRSKYILIELDNSLLWIIHLGMSGKVLLVDELPEQPAKHDHVLVRFENDSGLIYNDARRFGLMTLIETASLPSHPLFVRLGPEPLENNFTPDYLYSKLQNKTSPIKQVIMDSHVVVGVGNIYACESLFRSNIAPQTPANSIDRKKTGQLTQHIKKVLEEAIASGGSTLRDYVRSDGDLGYFQHRFAVYGRENEPCPHCQTPIQRIKQQGRSSFYCPQCQSKK